MSRIIDDQTVSEWKSHQKIAFRIAFIYLLLLCIPTYWGFYEHIINLKLAKVVYHDTQTIVAFWPPQWITIETEAGVFGWLNYINLIFVFLLSVLLGVLWTWLDKKNKNYDKLYYWIIVIARYRLAYGMIGWGLKKIFPMQMVWPTIGMLNTPYLNFAEKKLYWSHVGVSPGYTVFLGFAEYIPGLLLLHRKTYILGAALAGVICLNIAIANHAYDAGVAVPAAYFAIIGLLILWYRLPAIWNLTVLKQDIIPYSYYPDLKKTWQKYGRLGLKVAGNGIFWIGATILWWYGWQNEHNNYNIPNTPGISGSTGYYEVTEFRLNNKIIPYSPEDSIRWHDAIFERWSSLSYSTNRESSVDRMIGYSPLRVKKSKNKSLNEENNDFILRRRSDGRRKRDLGVTRWEIGGMAGDRRYFYYDADTVSHVLYLQNKNRNHEEETQVLHYSQPTPTRIILKGINEFKDSIYVILDRSNKKYPLIEGRRKEEVY